MFSHPLATIVVTVAPTRGPLALGDVKAHLRITHTEQDAYVQALLETAIAKMQAMANVCFGTQTIEVAYDGAPAADVLALPREPIQAVTQVVTYDTTDAETTLASSEYFADLAHTPPRLCLAAGGAWPCGLRARRSIVATCVAGWVAPKDVPPTLTYALQVLIAGWYTQPATVGVVPDQVLALMAPYPRWGLA